MRKLGILLFFLIGTIHLCAQEASLLPEKQRLDFAKMYFEIGATFLPSFDGKIANNDKIQTFTNPASAIPYLNWGGFHFWGHGEFYVSFPLSYQTFKKEAINTSEISHSVATGFRYYPKVYREKSIIPYVGLNWSALEFKQTINVEEEQPSLAKDFILAADAGILYGYKGFTLRLGVNYLPTKKWDYPISKVQKAAIKTPNFGFQLGLLYAWDSTKDTDEENITKWNSYPTVSKQSLGATTFGDFFIGIGPSISFSLKKSTFNQTEFPYLQDQLASSNYFDLVAGYNFNKLGLFTTLSFRNPKFETEGYGTKQTIKKNSLTFEVNKFLIDYSGFTPYLGINVAYDQLKYTEDVDGVLRELSFDKKIETGLTFGWDIQPGKNQEALILRTNLRWYPFSSFEVDGKKFNFSQLEYNLIQVVFYPGRLKNRKR